ncbi:MAG: hypothetical protein ACOYVK_17800 [Bacillota bacterium]
MDHSELISLTKKFVEFCDLLLMEGRITQEQYCELTKYKKEFLQKVS